MGDLFTMVMCKYPKHRVSEKAASRYTLQITNALAYLKSCSVYHRDIKPENFLLTSGDQVKL